MDIYAGAPSPCLGELTLCADVILTVMDSQPFAWSERAIRMCGQNASTSCSKGFVECLSARLDVAIRP